MNSLIKNQSDFLRLLISTSSSQQTLLIKSIQPKQMEALVQIAYNVLIGNRTLSKQNKKQLKRHRMIIRRFVSKSLSLEKRKNILCKYFKYILKLIKPVAKEL